MRFLLDGGGPKPNVRVLIRHTRGETGTQRRSHVETQADGREAATSPGMDAWHPQEPEEAGRTLPWSLRTELSPGTP